MNSLRLGSAAVCQQLRTTDDSSRAFEFRWVRDSLESLARLPRTQGVHATATQNMHAFAPRGKHSLSGILEACQAVHQLANRGSSIRYRITDSLHDFLLLPLRDSKP